MTSILKDVMTISDFENMIRDLKMIYGEYAAFKVNVSIDGVLVGLFKDLTDDIKLASSDIFSGVIYNFKLLTKGYKLSIIGGQAVLELTTNSKGGDIDV